MKLKISLMFAGWATVVIGLFLATLAGSIAEEQFMITGNGRQFVQAVVMSVIIVPIVLYLYKQFHKHIRKDENPPYSMKRSLHFFTGFLFVTGLGFAGLFIAHTLGWISIEQWHAPNGWVSALLINMLIAFFYEAFPEELALRGLVYDVLRHRFAIWLSILAQTFIFVLVALSVLVLQAIFGMVTFESILFSMPNFILLFFFGIALALIRECTGSLWSAVGFHLGYLALARFVFMPNEYGAPPIVTFQDTIGYGIGAMFLIAMVILGAILTLLILFTASRWRR